MIWKRKCKISGRASRPGCAAWRWRAPIVDIGGDGIGDADTADQQRGQSDKHQKAREEIEESASVCRRILGRADSPLVGRKGLTQLRAGPRRRTGSRAPSCSGSGSGRPAGRARPATAPSTEISAGRPELEALSSAWSGREASAALISNSAVPMRTESPITRPSR